MKDDATWSFPLGRFWGVQVRLHVLVPLFGIACGALAWQWNAQSIGISQSYLFLLLPLGWMLAVACHECGRLAMAWQLGCDVRGMTMMPWGSVLRLPPIHGLSRILIYASGPVANAACALLGAVLCIGLFDTRFPADFFNPFQPITLMEAGSTLEDAFRIAIWSNLFVAVVNLAPVTFFDGGHVVVGLVHLALPHDSPHSRQSWVTLIGQIGAIGLIIVAIVLGAAPVSGSFGTGTYLLLIGVILVFAARLPWDDEAIPFGGRLRVRTDVSQVRTLSSPPPRSAGSGHSLPERDFAGLDEEPFADELESWQEPSGSEEETLSTWLRERQSERVEHARRQELENEAEEERLVDSILEKVHDGGLACLTPEEKQILDRVSARYRKRSREEA